MKIDDRGGGLCCMIVFLVELLISSEVFLGGIDRLFFYDMIMSKG